MAKNDQELAARLEKQLRDYRVDGQPLPGIASPAALTTLVEQLVESIHRVDFVKRIRDKKDKISERRTDPKDDMFDPIRAAVWHAERGNIDEAFWIVFLFVACGRNLKTGYGLLRMVYGAFNDQFVWTWEQYHSVENGFTLWLHDRLPAIEKEKARFKFGNHRQYESIRHLDGVLQSYASWVGPERSHVAMIEAAKAEVGDDPKKLFAHLYKSMDAVDRFGRLGKFDYLTMVSKVGLANIEPPSAYMTDATGPATGAQLLFGVPGMGKKSRKKMDELAIALDCELKVGMQVIEDSLCNWQKSPEEFVAFRG
ncbi:hypothetical protein QO239_03140 [Cupriavidus taiwanensis]|uniref:alpha-glutamyl/putrescinyl thymine pyrophosphorylase clade 3 protein n=1 Tax=Cupriavidus taiwanensis TaxID=164546 RepID=UPI0025417A69|nr:hypothetical protein [Cupriavidus taiwanensis]MDK3021599.1 hypothetical protein [Cupriavidus taiwanensis]